MKRPTTTCIAALSAAFLLLPGAACDDGSTVDTENDATSIRDTTNTTDSTSDTTDTTDSTSDTPQSSPDSTADSVDVAPDSTPTPDVTVDPNRFEVGPRACCLAMDGDRVVWSEDGDLWQLDLETRHKSPLVAAPGLQMNPAISGQTLIWSDSRGGDFDLWIMDLGDSDGVGRTAPTLLRGGPGDQDQAALDGTRLVWVGRDDAPHTAREAEIWTLDLTDPTTTERRITQDGFEQTQPDVSGSKIVWADFAHSLDAIYIDVNDPLRNNADIYGHDLSTDTSFIVTDNPSKQLRPAISGDAVTWLDWRDINPEPKYSEFQVFARRLGPGLENTERRLAWSSWSRPELWRRPAIHNDMVVFIAEPTTPGTGFLTGLLAARIDGGAPWLVAGSTKVIDSVVVRGLTAAWVGGGTLGKIEIRTR